MKKDDENFGLLGDEEQEEESGELQRRKDKLKFFRVIKTINCIFSSLLFCLGIILLIDYVFYSEEFTKIPVKCFSNGECDFPALAPSKKPPHLIYLGFKGFSQNYREYVDSIAIEQFYEENLYVKKVKEKCWPMIKNSDFGARKSFTGEDISENSTALPCGLIAYSYPDIKLDVSIPGNITKKLPLYTFKTSPRFYQEIYKIKNDSKSWLNFKDEIYFQNWVNPSITPNFRKFYGVVREELEDKKLKINLSIGRLKQAKLAGFSDIVIVHSGFIGQKYPFTSLLSFFLCVVCFLFYEKVKKKINFLESYL